MPSWSRTAAALTALLGLGVVLTGCAMPGSAGPSPAPTTLGGPTTAQDNASAEAQDGEPPSAAIHVPTVVGDDVEVTWESSDPDGDPLSHTLLYSSDDGLLGTGEKIYCQGDWHSVGKRTISVTATDSTGATQTEQLVVRVVDVYRPLDPDLRHDGALCAS